MSEFATLLKAARNLDPQALTALFDLCSPALYKFTSRFVHHPTQADSIIADVFARLVEDFARGGGPRANLRSYLYRIAYHRILEQDREVVPPSSLKFIIPPHQSDPSISMRAQKEHQAMMQILLSTMNQELSADQRLIIVLRFLEDFSLKETAEIMGRDVNNVKVIQSRGLARLKKAMQLEPDQDSRSLLRF